MNDLPKSILQTLSYFDLFEMPLTSAEVFEYLYWPHREQPSLNEVQGGIDELVETGKVYKDEGFYSLSSEIKVWLKQKKSRQARAMEWLRDSKKWLTFLAAWPGVEAIAVCNNLSWFQAKETSDIDLFIITKPGQIWQTRFVLAAFLQLFKKRTTPDSNDSAKFCLSFFITSDQLDIKKMMIDEEDIYLSYWCRFLLPLYDPNKLIDKFLSANRSLYARVIREKPEYFLQRWQVDDKSTKFRLAQLLAAQGSWLPNPLEKITRKWQQKKFPSKIKEVANDASKRVVISDSMLKFHTNDRRQQFLTDWKNSIAKYENAL